MTAACRARDRAVEGGARTSSARCPEGRSSSRDQAARSSRTGRAKIRRARPRFIRPLSLAIPETLRNARIQSWRARQREPPPSEYTASKPIADKIGDYSSARPRADAPHPFPLHKKFEAARGYSEADLFRALGEIADLEIKRKSGGFPVDVGLETFMLSRLRG